MVLDQRLIRLGRHYGRHVHPCLSRCAVADARMAPLPVVEYLYVLGEGCTRFSTRPEPDAMSHPGFQRAEEALHGRIAPAVPFRLIDAVTRSGLAGG